METTSGSQPARPAPSLSSCAETALATRLLRGVESRYGIGAPAVCECWEEEVCVVGTLVDGEQRLAFVFVQPGPTERFGVLLDRVDTDDPERVRGLDFDALCGVVGGHLWPAH